MITLELHAFFTMQVGHYIVIYLLLYDWFCHIFDFGYSLSLPTQYDSTMDVYLSILSGWIRSKIHIQFLVRWEMFICRQIKHLINDILTSLIADVPCLETSPKWYSSVFWEVDYFPTSRTYPGGLCIKLLISLNLFICSFSFSVWYCSCSIGPGVGAGIEGQNLYFGVVGFLCNIGTTLFSDLVGIVRLILSWIFDFLYHLFYSRISFQFSLVELDQKCAFNF